jgi:hypothetical protein
VAVVVVMRRVEGQNHERQGYLKTRAGASLPPPGAIAWRVAADTPIFRLIPVPWRS